ncbi:MAG: hypothetical protein ACR2N0_06270 [Rubrobacteraceae bacterium]|jgi:hypothetical protein
MRRLDLPRLAATVELARWIHASIEAPLEMVFPEARRLDANPP